MYIMCQLVDDHSAVIRFAIVSVAYQLLDLADVGFFFSSRRRHTRSSTVSWARRCV